MSQVREGGCQCRKIRYRIDAAEPPIVAACHCTECQRQSGSAFGMSMIVPRESFALIAGKPRSFKRDSDSGKPVECFFCADCGTRLFHTPASMGATVNVKPGTLDDTSDVTPKLHIWTSSRQSWVQIPDDVPQFKRQPGDG
jgi:hypothetical protein